MVKRKKHSYLEALQLLYRLEGEFPIYDLTCEGFCIWPFIRFELFEQLFAPHQVEYETKNKAEDLITVSSLRNLLSSSYWNWKERKDEFAEMKAKSHYHKFDFNVDYSPKDFVLFSLSVHRSLEYEGKYFNRCSDALAHYLKDKGSIGFVECDIQSFDTKPSYNKVSDIDLPLLNHYFDYRQKYMFKVFFDPSKQLKINRLEEFKDWISEHYPYLFVNEYKIYSAVLRILGYKSFFDKYFKKVKPKMLFNDVFSHLRSYGAILSAKEHGIKTVDIQHGLQGQYHHLYGMYNNPPKNGYEILPQYFLGWSQQDGEAIHRWAQYTNGGHEGILGGNLLLSLIKSGKIDVSNARLDHITKPIATFALQELEDVGERMLSIITETILALNGEYYWVFRMHPVFSTDADQNKLKKFLSVLDPNEYEIQLNSSMTLFELLTKSDYLLTESSTVSLEALAFDASVIIMSDYGKAYLGEYLNTDDLLFADNKDDLYSILKSKEKSKADQVFCVDPKEIEASIAQFLDPIMDEQGVFN